jgi:branched-chain amino acid transport system substrate-binding protein
MAMTRRTVVRGLGAGVLGAGALSACGPGAMRRGRPRATTTAPTAGALVEPDQPLVIGQIGASYGRMGLFEESIAVALDESRIDINAEWDGLFDHEVVLLERHVMESPGEDLAPVIAEMADAGATCVVTSIDEESLIAAMPALVEAQLAILDVFTSGMSVRAAEVQTANLLVRLAPNDRTLAARYAEEALGGGGDRSGPAGAVAFLSEDTLQGRSLLAELTQMLNPRSGQVVSEQFYAARVQAVLKSPPALLVANGGAELAPFLSALHTATLDEGQRPTVQFPRRVPPWATIDYSSEPVAEDLVPEALTSVTGYEPGGELSIDHENMMLNRSPEFLRRGYAYSQQAYDAIVMLCLAAQHQLAVEGTALAAGLPAILTGTEECTDFETCRRIMTTALDAGDRATVSYVGRSGALELGAQSDARVGQLREYTWSEANVLDKGTAGGFEAPE